MSFLGYDYLYCTMRTPMLHPSTQLTRDLTGTACGWRTSHRIKALMNSGTARAGRRPRAPHPHPRRKQTAPQMHFLVQSVPHLPV